MTLIDCLRYAAVTSVRQRSRVGYVRGVRSRNRLFDLDRLACFTVRSKSTNGPGAAAPQVNQHRHTPADLTKSSVRSAIGVEADEQGLGLALAVRRIF
jgi:hypothetical protein